MHTVCRAHAISMAHRCDADSQVSLLQSCSTFLCFQCCKKLPNCLADTLDHARRQRPRVCFPLHPHQQSLRLILDFSHPCSTKWYLIAVLICVSLTTRGSEHVVVCFFSICVSSLAGFPGGSDSKESAYNAGDPGKSGSSDRFYFSWAPKSLWMVTTAMKLKDSFSLERKL